MGLNHLTNAQEVVSEHGTKFTRGQRLRLALTERVTLDKVLLLDAKYREFRFWKCKKYSSTPSKIPTQPQDCDTSFFFLKNIADYLFVADLLRKLMKQKLLQHPSSTILLVLVVAMSFFNRSFNIARLLYFATTGLSRLKCLAICRSVGILVRYEGISYSEFYVPFDKRNSFN